MSARDAFHTVVKNALIKEGWQITHDPFSISFGGVNMSIDLGSQKLIAAENSQRKIAVKIKSFLPQSIVGRILLDFLPRTSILVGVWSPNPY